MAAARLAPVLSATSRMDRICNIYYACSVIVSSGRYLRYSAAARNDFDQSPALGFRKWPGFLDPNSVAHLRFALFIVRVKFLVTSDDFAVTRMNEPSFDANRDGLGHLIRDDFTEAFLAL